MEGSCSEVRLQVEQLFGSHRRKTCCYQEATTVGSWYYNYKGLKSIIFMAGADAWYKFLYVDVGAEGSASDGGTWKHCTLFDAV